YWFGNPPQFENGGLVRKSAGSGTSTIGVSFNNSGTVEGQVGTITFSVANVFGGQFNVASGAALNFSSGGTITGTFNAAAGATVTFSGGNFGVIPKSSLTGAGTYILSGGELTLQEVIANLQLSGGTIHLSPSFQGGTITNLTVNGVTL